jgi:hypothetical protein
MAGIALDVLASARRWPSPSAYLSAAVVAVALITFFGVLHGLKSPGQKLEDGAIRTAITVSIVSVYLVIVGMVAFFSGERELPSITSTMLTSFTALVAIVVPFYFGSTAYVQAKSGQGTEGTPAQTTPTQAAAIGGTTTIQNRAA